MRRVRKGDTADHSWYSVRCVFRDDDVYEERITLWRAGGYDEAIARAEDEARRLPSEYLGLAQAFWLFDEPADGREVFSMLRQSTLCPSEYVSRYFDTGDEIQAK